jgi:hypothetical protein
MGNGLTGQDKVRTDAEEVREAIPLTTARNAMRT